MFNKKSEKKGKVENISLISLTDKTSPISEQYRTIRTNIQFKMKSKNFQTLVITSSGAGEGKSTTSANLAVVFANSGIKTLLVDADLRKPTVAKTFSLPNFEGFSTLLGDYEKRIEDVSQKFPVDNLTIMTSGPKPPNPSEMLGSARMNKVIQEMRAKYELIIFDMPPVAAVTDAQIMASKVDGTILLVREAITLKNSLKKSLNLLNVVDANLLGIVYNGSSRAKNQGYYYGT